ncbi:hypothetical protein NLI96_g5716 [Meripilus lineatus]|uniref:RRM domain-containing protein n=1 Tax=Meripilus lineatus TaxID=2056292 RepID=A0AAD5V322_9APHY|nr:hypothetical protein NLI96_g5716 [Physisporinus lineatus]
MTRPPPSPDLLRMRFPVIVHPLSRVTCWQELKDFGRLAGGVVAFCDVDKVRSRGFIEYLSREDAERAVAELSGRELNGSLVTLTLGWGQPGRSRSRSPPRQRDRETRRPHPYNDPRPPSGPYDYWPRWLPR